MLIQVRYTDPRSQEAAVLSNALTSFVTCDQGSVAPTSQSQRYYDKILTILSDPRTLAPLVRLSGTYQGSGISRLVPLLWKKSSSY